MKKTSFTSFVLLLLAGTGYGSIFVANKLVAENGFPTSAYLFWISFLGTILVFPLCFINNKDFDFSIENITHFPISATFGMILPFAVVYFVADKLPSGIISILFTLAPIFTYIFSYLLKVEVFRWISLIAIFFGVSGVLMIALPETSLPNKDNSTWVIFGLLAPLSAAINNIFVAKFRPPKISSFKIVFGVLLASTIIILPLMLLTEGVVLFWEYNLTVIAGIFWATCVHLIGFFCLYEVIRMAGPIFFSQIAYIIIFTAVIWGYLLFDENHSSWAWIAILLMFIGLVLANYSAQKNH